MMMLDRLISGLIALALSFALVPSVYRSAPETAEVLPADLVEATCTRVVDGDTIVASIDGTEIRVRLIGVDTPETVNPNVPDEPYGAEASAYTKAALTGQAIYLEYDVERTDRYGRDLCYVWLADGTLFNEHLVREGYATIATFPPNVKYVERFRESAAFAYERGAGLYAAG